MRIMIDIVIYVGQWTNRHQMSVNGKTDHFTKWDILAVAKQFGIKGATEILARVIEPDPGRHRLDDRVAKTS